MGILLLLFYFFIFPLPLHKELIIAPVWHIESLESLSGGTINLGTRPGEISEDEKYISEFKIGNVFGFIDLKGNLKYLDHVDYQVTISETNFINYSNLPNNFVVQNMVGEYVSSFWENGYPRYSGNRLFMIKSDTTGLSEIDEQGKILWSLDFTSLLTSMSVTEQYICIGLLDGRLILINNLGEAVYKVTPGGSRIQVIYGCSINSDATVIAGISGLNPQRFFYIKGPDFEKSTVNFIDLDNEFRREILITFADSERHVFFEGKNILNVFDLQEQKLKQIPVNGNLKGLEEFETRNIIALLSESDKGTELKVVRLNDNLLYMEVIPHYNVYMKNINDSLLIGYERKEDNGVLKTHLIRYDLKEM